MFSFSFKTAAAIFALAVLSLPAAAGEVTLTAGGATLAAEVAANLDARRQGLSHRATLAANGGMLFVFPSAQRACFWMKDTSISLAIAFLNEDGRVINIAHMRPQSTQSHCAQKPAHFALEVNDGWFAKNNVAPSDIIGGVHAAPPAPD